MKLFDPLLKTWIFSKASSLSRLYDKLGKGECGIISAYRSTNTKKQNQEASNRLRLLLLRPGYSVTPVKGSYIEDFNTPNAVEVKEESYFIQNVNSKVNLKKLLIELGKSFEQDSIFWIDPTGERGELVGTKRGTYPGLNKSIIFKGHTFGKENEFMTKIRNRPFYFNSADLEDLEVNVQAMQGICELRKNSES